jgi:3-hydroxyisobutyrate dehydrogenase
MIMRQDTVITVLPEPQHVKSVFENIYASSMPAAPTNASRLYIDCSTIDPTTSRSVASIVQSLLSDSGATFVDAPMSGGVVGARAGTLTFMVGCEPDIFSHVEKILLLMGKKVWHLGSQGSGLSGKLANNYALAINNIAAAEAMNLGIKWGLDPKALGNLINSSTGRSWPSEVNNPVPGVVETAAADRDYEGGFGVSLMKKDLKLAIRAAKEAGAHLELAAKAEEIYEKVEQSHKGKDFSVVYRWLGEKS